MGFVEAAIRRSLVKDYHIKGAGALCLLGVLIGGCSSYSSGQSPADEPETPVSSAQPFEQSPPVQIKSLPKNLLLDQKDFWSAPLHMSEKQWDWALPSVLVGGLLIKADGNIEKHVPTGKNTVSHSVTASNAGVAVLAAAGGGLFLLGHLQKEDQKRETGILAGEAAIGAFLDTEVFKYAAGRERPFTGSGTGRFFVGGDSFPSTHASVSWAIASVIAHEYPGPLTQFLAYGMAGSVSGARWAGQKHLSSDVIIGSALGWYMGYQIFHAHSRYSDAERARYGKFYKGVEEDEEVKSLRETRNMGSSYVPLDGWVYPALERLAALGYIDSNALGL